LTYPIRKKVIPFDRVLGIELTYTDEDSNHTPEVHITTFNKEDPIKLSKMGVDANSLYQAVKRSYDIWLKSLPPLEED